MNNMAHPETLRVAIGVDTHLDSHVAAVKDELGRDLASKSFVASTKGYRELLAWVKGFGTPIAFGVEGTGSYGAGLSRYLTAAEETVKEVTRPNRRSRRRHGKSDPADARAAAAAVLSGDASGAAKSADSTIEMIRVVRTAKTSAMKARTQALNVLKSAVVSAPAQLREELEHLAPAAFIRRAAAVRPGAVVDPTAAAKHAIRALARRYQDLDKEVAEHVELLDRLTASAAPRLVATFGIGPDSAAALLVAAGDNPERMGSEAAFSKLCGASPIDASSGKQVRHRLSRGGNRQANAALFRIVLVRLRYHEPTKAYVSRRTAEGKTKKEIIRCLKRFVAREVYNTILSSLTAERQIADVSDVA